MYNTYSFGKDLFDGDIVWAWCSKCMARTDHILQNGCLICLSHNKIPINNKPEFVFANL